MRCSLNKIHSVNTNQCKAQFANLQDGVKSIVMQ